MAKKHNPVHAEKLRVEGSADHAVPAATPTHDYLQILIERLRAGRVVLCAGAALGAGKPMWRGMVDRLLDQLSKHPGNEAAVSEARGLAGSYPLSVCGFLRRRLGDDFGDAVRKAMPDDANSEARKEAIHLASKLPFRALLTTALDDELIHSCAEEKSDVRIYRADQAEEVKRDGRGRYVLRLLGGSDEPEFLLFSESDLRGLLADESFRNLIGDLYNKRSFLFIGFDPSDPDFGIVVDRMLVSASKPAAVSPGAEPQHFALFTGVPRVVQEEIEAAYGISALPTEQFSGELGLLRALNDALGDHAGEMLPDDDDLEGWLRVLQQEPNRSDAIGKLAAIEEKLESNGDADRLIELWLGRTEVETSGAGRAHCLRQVAAIFERKKGQMAEAFAALLAAFKESPELAQLDELERLAGTSGLWSELLGALRELMPNLPAEARPDLWLRIARLYGDKLKHTEYALVSLGEAQKLEISDAATRRKVSEMRVELTRRAERWKELADAIGQLASEVPESERERRIDLYLEQGELYETRLSDGVSATAAFKKARAADPASRDALQALEHSLRRHAAWSDLIALLDEKATLCESAGDEAAALSARREAAQLCTEHTSDRKQAVSRWETVRKSAPADLETLRALEKLYSQEGSSTPSYFEVLTALADHVPSDKERLSFYRRLYAEYEEMPGHQAQSESCLHKILQIDPNAEDAYRGLERLYHKERRFPQLVEIYERHIEALGKHSASGEGDSTRIDLLAALGRIYEIEIPAGDAAVLQKEAPAAIAVWKRVLDIKAEHLHALDALGRLYQLTEQYSEAVKVLEKRAHLTEDKAQKAALHFEIGRLCERHHLDTKTTEEHFVRALEIDPQHVQATSALAGLYRGQKEYLRAAKLYTEAEERSQNRLDKTRYLVEAGKQHLAVEAKDKAKALFEKALKLDPEHIDAAAALSEIFWQEQRLDEALPLLEVLTRKSDEPLVQVGRFCRLGQAAKVLGQREKALRAYQRAVDLDPQNLVAVRGLIPLLSQAGMFVDAQKITKGALDAHGESLSLGERVELLSTLGESELKLEHLDAAREALREALDLNPYHQASLRTLLKHPGLAPVDGVELRRSLGKALLTHEATGGILSVPHDTTDERLRLSTEIGDLLAGPLGNAGEAAAAYKEGLELRPDSHLILHKLLELYTSQQMWTDAADVLDTLIAHEQSAKRRARYHLTAALICRDELKDAKRALGHLNAALDDEPGLERAIEALEGVAVMLDDPRELVRVYQRKIKQLGPDGNDTPKQRAERLRLWTALSMLCIQRLGDVDTGATAYEVTVALDAQNLDRRRQMAAIYGQLGGDRIDKAIAEHHQILARNKAELESYRALKDLYTRSMQREKAAAVAYALHLLRKDDPEDLALIDEMKARPLRPATRTLSKELWRLLQHPEEDARLGALFSALRDVGIASHARSWRELGLNRKDRADMNGGTFYAKALRYGFEVLDAPMPEVYAQPDDPELAEHSYKLVVAMDKDAQANAGNPANAPTFCLLLGKPLLSPKRPDREVTFEIGRLAAMMRPERALRNVYSTAAQLGLIIDAAIAIGSDSADSSRVSETAQGLRRALSPAALEQVKRIGQTLRETGTQGEAAAATWLGFSDLTAVRAGLTLSGDLETVALLLATDPPGLTNLSPKQRLLDTIHFTVTEEFFTIRQHLGLMA